jgi:HD-GYP domain-containing protein (c-di-GMP phosphodiesterase class II)
MTDLSRRRFLLATGYALAGLAVLVSAAAFDGRFPSFWRWLLFAVTFVVLEFNSVEVNDRLFQSSSVMVALTAGIVFSLEGSSAALGLAAMAALGPFLPADLRERRWFQPMANMGQMTISAGAAGLVLDVMLADVGFATRADLARIVVAGVVASLAYTLINWQMVRMAVRLVYRTRDVVPWSRMNAVLSSLLTMGIVGGLLGATMVLVDPAVTPLILVVYLIGHLSLSSHAQLREAHEATLRGFVKALEAKDLYTRGHTERVAYFAQLIGAELSFSGTQLERLRWAALIHDVGKLAVPGELIRKKGRLMPAEYAEMKSHAHMVEEILAEVDFLQPMVEIASGHHSNFDGSGYGGRGHRAGHQPSLDSCILSVADSFDAMTSTRSYRMALTQSFAIEELRRNSGSQFHPDVIDALERGLRKVGETYGSSDVDNEELARRLAEQQVTSEFA